MINKRDETAFSAGDEKMLEALTNQMSIALENSILIEELKASFDSFVETLTATVDAKHPLTAGHSRRVTIYSGIIAEHLGLSDEEREVLRYAAMFHDIGKIGIPDQVLLKDGPFSPEEKAIMDTHASITRDILDKIRFPKKLSQVPEVAELHHERLDCRGYPRGLCGDEIPLGARIMAVADVFDALTTKRDYPKYTHKDGLTLAHDPLDLDCTLSILLEGAGTHFDPTVVEALIQCLPKMADALEAIGDPNITHRMIAALDQAVARQGSLDACQKP